MSSSAQKFANRENSKFSTGPRTPDGKAASSANAKTHGFNAADPVLPHEDRDEYNALLERHKSDFAPETAHEEFLVTQMAGAQWKLNRLERMENDMFTALGDISQALTDNETAPGFARLERYRASLERTYHRCARELRATRKVQNKPNCAEPAENKLEDLVRQMYEAPPPAALYEALAAARRASIARQNEKNPANAGS